MTKLASPRYCIVFFALTLSITPAIWANGVSPHFQKLSQLLTGCQFHFVKLGWELSSFNFEENILPAMSHLVTVSVQTKLDLQPWYFKTNTTFKHTCLIHSYFYSEMEHANAQHLLHGDFMTYFITHTAVWPHHTIFVGTLLPLTQKFYQDFRAQIYGGLMRVNPLRGFILFINYSENTVHLICVPCYLDKTPTFHPINLSTISDSYQLKLASSRLNSHLRGGGAFVQGNVTPEVTCMLLRQVPSYYKDTSCNSPSFHHCVLHALKSNFNYTLASTGSSERYILINHYTPHIVANHRNTHFDDFKIHSSYLSQYDTLMLSAHQQRPKMSIRIVTKPFSHVVWLLFIASAIILGIVTWQVERIRNFQVKTS